MYLWVSWKRLNNKIIAYNNNKKNGRYATSKTLFNERHHMHIKISFFPLFFTFFVLFSMVTITWRFSVPNPHCPLTHFLLFFTHFVFELWHSRTHLTVLKFSKPPRRHNKAALRLSLPWLTSQQVFSARSGSGQRPRPQRPLPPHLRSLTWPSAALVRSPERKQLNLTATWPFGECWVRRTLP